MTDIAPSSVPIQQESVQFNQPVSEAAASSIGAATNYLLYAQLPVGSLIDSMLNPTQFNAQIGSPATPTWVPCDGSSVIGSLYQTVTGNTNVPDFRGIFRRGLNNFQSGAGVRSDGNQNPDDPTGAFSPGQYTADKVGPHNHPYIAGERSAGGADGSSGNGGLVSNNALTTSNNSGNETAPKNNSVFVYIRIN